MKYFTIPIKKMYVKNMKLHRGAYVVETANVVLKKDAPFYLNMFGRLISFEHNTFLPSAAEAESFVVETAKKNPNNTNIATCMYADYGNITTHDIDREEFCQLKKIYKDIRKINKKKK